MSTRYVTHKLHINFNVKQRQTNSMKLRKKKLKHESKYLRNKESNFNMDLADGFPKGLRKHSDTRQLTYQKINFQFSYFRNFYFYEIPFWLWNRILAYLTLIFRHELQYLCSIAILTWYLAETLSKKPPQTFFWNENKFSFLVLTQTNEF